MFSAVSATAAQATELLCCTSIFCHLLWTSLYIKQQQQIILNKYTHENKKHNTKDDDSDNNNYVKNVNHMNKSGIHDCDHCASPPQEFVLFVDYNIMCKFNRKFR